MDGERRATRSNNEGEGHNDVRTEMGLDKWRES
jgi:hypothetical protein